MRLDALQSQMLVCQARSLRARLKYLIGKVARATGYVYFHLLARFEKNQPQSHFAHLHDVSLSPLRAGRVFAF